MNPTSQQLISLGCKLGDQKVLKGGYLHIIHCLGQELELAETIGIFVVVSAYDTRSNLAQTLTSQRSLPGRAVRQERVTLALAPILIPSTAAQCLALDTGEQPGSQ